MTGRFAHTSSGCLSRRFDREAWNAFVIWFLSWLSRSAILQQVYSVLALETRNSVRFYSAQKRSACDVPLMRESHVISKRAKYYTIRNRLISRLAQTTVRLI